jgi:hypothetical protein
MIADSEDSSGCCLLGTCSRHPRCSMDAPGRRVLPEARRHAQTAAAASNAGKGGACDRSRTSILSVFRGYKAACQLFKGCGRGAARPRPADRGRPVGGRVPRRTRRRTGGRAPLGSGGTHRRGSPGAPPPRARPGIKYAGAAARSRRAPAGEPTGPRKGGERKAERGPSGPGGSTGAAAARRRGRACPQGGGAGSPARLGQGGARMPVPFHRGTQRQAWPHRARHAGPTGGPPTPAGGRGRRAKKGVGDAAAGPAPGNCESSVPSNRLVGKLTGEGYSARGRVPGPLAAVRTRRVWQERTSGERGAPTAPGAKDAQEGSRGRAGCVPPRAACGARRPASRARRRPSLPRVQPPCPPPEGAPGRFTRRAAG